MLIIAVLLLATWLLFRPRRTAPVRRARVYLEGNIGAGKSTLAAALARTGKYDVLAEPVREWQDVEGHNLLGLMGHDRQLWSFPFQVLALATHSRRDATAPATRPVLLLERSASASLRVFAQDMLETGILQPAHMAVLRTMWNALVTTDVTPLVYIYVRTPPDVAYRRARQRGRAEETSLPDDLFHRLHSLLDAWLLDSERRPVYVLDGTLSPDRLLEAAERVLARL